MFVPVDNPLVEATDFLGWQPAQTHGVVACVSLGHFQMLRAFISRCSIPRGGRDEDSAADMDLLAVRFPAAEGLGALKSLERNRIRVFSESPGRVRGLTCVIPSVINVISWRCGTAHFAFYQGLKEIHFTLCMSPGPFHLAKACFL